MSTATVVPENASVSADVTVENSTYVIAAGEVTKEGKDANNQPISTTVTETKFMTEAAAEKFFKKDEKTGKSEADAEGWSEAFRQTFQTPVAISLKGIQEIVPSEKEIVKLFERGKSNKAYQIIRQRMLEQDENGNYVFQPKEGVVDLKAEVAEETASRATTPE